MRQTAVPELLVGDDEIFDTFVVNDGFARSRWFALLTEPGIEQEGGVFSGSRLFKVRDTFYEAVGVGDKVHLVVVPEPVS